MSKLKCSKYDNKSYVISMEKPHFYEVLKCTIINKLWQNNYSNAFKNNKQFQNYFISVLNCLWQWHIY